MKKEGAGENPLIRSISGVVYKAFGFWCGELKTRLFGVRHKSWSMLIFENGIAKKIAIT